MLYEFLHVDTEKLNAIIQDYLPSGFLLIPRAQSGDGKNCKETKDFLLDFFFRFPDQDFRDIIRPNVCRSFLIPMPEQSIQT